MSKVNGDFMRGAMIGGGAFLLGYLFRGNDHDWYLNRGNDHD